MVTNFDFPGLDDNILSNGLPNFEEEVEPLGEANLEESESHAKRADNTIFKTGLGEYRKVLFVCIDVEHNR
jgi:hypothetical protein